METAEDNTNNLIANNEEPISNEQIVNNSTDNDKPSIPSGICSLIKLDTRVYFIYEYIPIRVP